MICLPTLKVYINEFIFQVQNSRLNHISTKIIAKNTKTENGSYALPIGIKPKNWFNKLGDNVTPYTRKSNFPKIAQQMLPTNGL